MMISQAKISPKDMEELCAYLDNELTEQERSSFEQKLARSVVLQKALIDQRRLSASMRALPVHKAPHNFTLTTLEARQARKGRFLVPVFSWASILAVALLAVLMVSEFVFKNFAVATAPVQTEVPMLAMAAENASDSSTSEIPPLLIWGYPNAIGMGGGGAGGSGLPYTAQAQPIPPGYGIGGGEGTTGKIGAEPTTPIPPQEGTAGIQAEATPIIFGIREDALGQVIETSKPAEQMVSAQVTEEMSRSGALISPVVKLTLAGLGVVFGLIAWLLYRKR